MKELQIVSFAGTEVVDSRDVAVMVEREHNELLKSIRIYCEHLDAGEIAHVDFFIESTYAGGNGQERPCYLITKKGCDMIANKMTRQKGVLFTAAYVTAFERMREKLRSPAQPALTAADYLKAAQIVSRCTDKRLQVVLSLLDAGGIKVEAHVEREEPVALVETAEPKKRKEPPRVANKYTVTQEERDAMADEALDILWNCPLTVQEMAALTGIGRVNLSQIRHGHRRAGPDRARIIIEVLKPHMKKEAAAV